MNKFLALFLLSISSLIFAADGWPQHLGPNRDGTVTAKGLFSAGKFTLAKAWEAELGSGFSGIVVGDGMVFAMHSSGENDVMSAFEASSGKKVWQYALAPTFKAPKPSEDGPLSTPLLYKDLVVGIGAKGDLFVLKAKTGSLVWKKNLVADFGGVVPQWGMATSPLIYGKTLIVQTGNSKGQSTVALDPMTGKIIWGSGSGVVSYQSPSVVNINGHDQLLAITAESLNAMDPATGKQLWDYKIKESTQLIAVDKDAILIDLDKGFCRLKISPDNKVEQVWANEVLELRFDMPVLSDGFLYGYKGKIMTCADAALGTKVWQAREPGKGMSIIVDDHLVAISEDGTLRVAPASSKGYEEKAALKVFTSKGLTAPSYADGLIFVRNYTHIVAVRVNH